MAIRHWLAAAIVFAATLAHAAEIRVLEVAPLSGIEATQGRAYAAGMNLYFAAVNKAGGVNGSTLTLLSADDQGRPELTNKLTEDLLVEQKPLLLAGYFGSANIAGLVRSEALERNRIALVGYRQTDLRTDAPNLFSTRATLDDEIRKITQHVATIGIRRLGLFYEEGSGSDRVVAFARQSAQNVGATVVAKASYPQGTVRAQAAADALAKASPQAILVVASGGAAAAFIEQFRSAGGTSQIFATSSADIEQLSRRLGEEQMQGVVIAQVTPNPYNVTNRIGKEFNDLVARSGPNAPPVSYATMEGFITAKVIAEAARRAGSAPTRESLLKALDKLGDLDLGGYVVGFGPDRRAGSRWVELTIVTSGGRIRQ